jgi:hypothetical protein
MMVIDQVTVADVGNDEGKVENMLKNFGLVGSW